VPTIYFNVLVAVGTPVFALRATACLAHPTLSAGGHDRLSRRVGRDT
jgi:hypothetical protein